MKRKTVDRWDKYFHDLCITVSSNSPCLSRKIGAILVKDKSVISTGYNGPPRGIPHCGFRRYHADDRSLIGAIMSYPEELDVTRFEHECPRKVLGYKSGEGLHLCIAQHAEENAITNAARMGVSTIGSTLYLNCVIPCKNCLGSIINAGIVEIVVEDPTFYDKCSKFLINYSEIFIRRFDI